MSDAYLDVETTGLSRFYHDITVIGIYLVNGNFLFTGDAEKEAEATPLVAADMPVPYVEHIRCPTCRRDIEIIERTT